MSIIIVALMIVCAKLWGDVASLRRRIVLLEVPGQRGPVDFEIEDRADVPATSNFVVPQPPEETEPEPIVVVNHDRRTADRVYEAEAAIDRVPATSSTSSSLEGLFGRTLPIWLGGLTLAVAGILVVRWSIERGLVSPIVRIVMGIAFGSGLIAAAEAGVRRSMSDPRIPQALAGAGIASLYGSVLAANLAYGMIGDAGALIAMIVITAIAGGLSMRFGAPSAVLGLVGGLAAPALLGGGEPDVVMLSIYVALVSAGAATLAHVQGRSWLGGVAMLGACLWAFMLGIVDGGASSVAVGLLVMIVGFGVPMILPSDGLGNWLRIAGGVVAVAQTALLTSLGGFGILQWAMMAFATAGVLLTSERGSFRDGPIIAFLVFVVTALSWDLPSVMALSTTLLVFVTMHAVHALRHLSFCETPRQVDAVRLSSLPIAALAILLTHLPTAAPATVATILVIAAGLSGLSSLATLRIGFGAVSRAFQPAAVIMMMSAFHLVLPHSSVAWATASLCIGLLWVRGMKTAAISAAILSTSLSAPSLVEWAAASSAAFFGHPIMVTAMPILGDVVLWMMPGLTCWSVIALRIPRIRPYASWWVGLGGMVIAHIVLHRIFGLSDDAQFITLGLFQRTVWEALLSVVAILAWKADRRIATVVACSAIAHFVWFTLLVYNPVWSEQFVGGVPLLNLVLLSHAVPLVLLWIAGRVRIDSRLAALRRVVQMVVIASLGLTLIRQIFAGSMLAGVPVSDGENIMRSVMAIVMGVSFLVHGMRSSSVEWRAGSLVVMLIAVTKVFLFDAADLDGLARVGSFAALGFSLIGVGWLYSRLLPQSRIAGA